MGKYWLNQIRSKAQCLCSQSPRLTTLSLSFALLVSPLSTSLGSDCSSAQPLLVGSVDYSIQLDETPRMLGRWALPVSPERPDLITAAFVAVQLTRSPEKNGWEATLSFGFPDPKPYGIPFTFQKAEISWGPANARSSMEIDWSAQCTSPGRSLFPRQNWLSTITLPASKNLAVPEAPVLRIWGSRN